MGDADLGPAVGDGRDPVAWEDPGLTFPAALGATWRASLMEPGPFFRRVDYGGGFLRPLLYFLLVVVGWSVLALAWQAVFPSPLPGMETDGAAAALSFFIMPFVALVGLVVGSLSVHAVAAFAGAERGLSATARVLCYAAGPAVFAVVPLVGALVAAGWSFAIQVRGLEEAHGLRTGEAVVAALVPGVLLASALFAFTLAVLRLAEGDAYPWLSLP